MGNGNLRNLLLPLRRGRDLDQDATLAPLECAAARPQTRDVRERRGIESGGDCRKWEKWAALSGKGGPFTPAGKGGQAALSEKGAFPTCFRPPEAQRIICDSVPKLSRGRGEPGRWLDHTLLR